MIEYKGQKAELTKNELKILYYLFKNAGKICSRNDIVDFLWDNQLYVDDNALVCTATKVQVPTCEEFLFFLSVGQF